MSECNSVEKTYQKNRLNGVKDYNKNDRGRLRQQARGYMHKFICRRKKNKKRIWNRCHNMSEGKKQKLKEYQKLPWEFFFSLYFLRRKLYY